ncbi:ANTAR domain-containing protein [Phycicoccus avicenniae]|uniref:ANTAR domain-containing protein n=1 Tax=Phycicoccus avicenniae TaxID=2828860 RepID=UPI003D291A14
MSDTTASERALAEHVAGVAAAILTAEHEPVSPDLVVRLAGIAVPDAGHAGLTLLRGERHPVTVAASGPVPLAVDELQYASREGPCLDAAAGPTVTLSADVGADDRWPDFGPACVRDTGVHSVLALRLPLGGTDHAALNLYAEATDAFSPADVVTGSVLAPLAALVLEAHLRRQDVGNLRAALESSRTIGMAVGILMANHRVGRDEAFSLLREASMALNTKVRDVAAEVTDTGTLPEVPD